MKFKNYFRTFFSLALLLLSVNSAFCHLTPPNSIGPNYDVFIDSDVIGTWQYTVESVPPEYSKGVLSIVDENGKYAVQVQLSEGTLKGDDITIEGNTIRFKVYIESGLVTVELTAKGDEISGTSSSSDGVYKIKGERLTPQ